MLKTSRFSSKAPVGGRKAPSSRRSFTVQHLENRCLLAGDVDVFQFFGNVFVFGDSDSNSVEVRLNEDGEAAVYGLAGTTINGGDDPVVIAGGDTISRDLRVYLGSGNDSILVDGVNVGDDLVIDGQRGDDAIGLLRTTVGDDVTIRGGTGDLSFSLDLSEVADDLRVTSLSGDDIVVFDGSTIGDDTSVITGSGDDVIVVRDSVHEDKVRLLTGRGDDYVAVIGTEIGDDVTVLMGSGSDDLLIRDSVLADRVYANGGRGSDNLELAGEVTLNPSRTPRLISFRNNPIEDAAERIDQAIAELVDSGARRPSLLEIATGNENFSILVQLVVQAGLVGALNTNAPLTVLAPTDAAFGDFIAEFGLTFNDDGSLAVPNELLASVLTFHVAGGAVPASVVVGLENIPTLQGGLVSVETTEEGLLLDGRAGLVLTDVRARNGIIHVIDAVLTPPIPPFEVDAA